MAADPFSPSPAPHPSPAPFQDPEHGELVMLADLERLAAEEQAEDWGEGDDDDEDREGDDEGDPVYNAAEAIASRLAIHRDDAQLLAQDLFDGAVGGFEPATHRAGIEVGALLAACSEGSVRATWAFLIDIVRAMGASMDQADAACARLHSAVRPTAATTPALVEAEGADYAQ